VIQAKADSAKANIYMVQAKSQSAQAVVLETQIPLHDTELKSPLNGLVLQKSIEKGTLVSSGDKAFVVADTSSVKAVFAVADVALGEMKLGSELSVVSESMPGKEFQGQITSVFPAADSKNRSFNVEVTIANPDYLLRPNMIVSLRVATKQAMPAQPVVPLNAVIQSKSNANGYAVIVVVQEGGREVARLRDVKLGESFGNAVAVADGLKQGDRVIVTGGTMVNDGGEVKVIP
jgi:multidrug efflux system membrane fusion protein